MYTKVPYTAIIWEDNPDSVSVLQYADRNGGPEAGSQVSCNHLLTCKNGYPDRPSSNINNNKLMQA
eukprot:3954863-Amphidinium_carterae.1